MKKIVWTPQIDDALETLLGLEENLTYLQVAAKMNELFGGGFTRNCCIGRAGRLRLPPRAIRPRPINPRKPKAKVITMPVRVDAPILPKEAVRKGNSRYLTIYQLDYGVCKYPSGDSPPYTYCGHATHGGASFCPDHYAVCYQKPRKEFC